MKIFGWTIGKEKKSYDAFGGSSTYLGAGYGNTKVSDKEIFAGWVFASVRAIADQVAQIELRLHKKQRGEDMSIEEHPAIELLNSVNPFFTRYTLFERLQSNLELYGNEYWLVEKDSKGIPIEIIPLNPTCMRVVRPDKATKDTYVEYYEYTVLGKIEKILPENIVHFKNYNPFSDVIGMSTLENARLLIETDFYTKEYNRRFFQNDATPNTVLTHPDSLSNEETQRILDKWNDKFSGFRKAHKPALLHGGMDIKLLGNHSDMQFIEQSRMTRDDILAMFGVPKTVLGVTEDVTVSNAQASNYIFSLRTIKPKMYRITDTLNEFYLPLFKDESLYFDFKSPVKEDQIEVTTANATKFNNGQLTINEWRKQDGLPPVEGGDVVFLPFSLTAYGRPIEAKKIEPAIGKSLALTLKENIREVIRKEAESDIQVPDLVPSQSTAPNFSANNSQTSMNAEKFEALGKAINDQQRKREEPYIRKMKIIMDDIFSDQSREAEKNLLKFIKTKGKKVITKEKLPDFIDKSKWVTVTINLITPLMGDLFQEEGKNAYRNLGLDPDDFSLSTPTAQDFLRKNAKKFAGEVTEHTSQLLRDEIALGLDGGEGVVDLTARIATMSGFSDNRSEMIALTETHRTAGESELQAWQESGVVTKKIWYTALDERVCFPRGTRVMTVGGEKPIETIRLGDSIKTPQGYKKVTKLFERDYDGKFVLIATNDGRVVCSTDNHPFLVNDYWIRADKIKDSDKLNSFEDKTIQVTGVIHFKFSESNSRPTILFESGVSADILRSVMPISTINFNGNFALYDSKINGVSTNLVLGNKGDTQLFKALSHGSFQSILSPESPIAREVTKDSLASWSVSKKGVTTQTPLSINRSPTFLGAMDSLPIRLSPKSLATRFAWLVNSIRESTLFTANRVTVSHTSIYRKILRALRTGFSDLLTLIGNPITVIATKPLILFPKVGIKGSQALLAFSRNGFVSSASSDIGSVKVYNIEVEGEHVYYANGVLVHNCAECDALHGTEIPLDDDFVSVRDLQAMGYSNYDGAIEITQLHPQCRCSAIPVIEEE